MPIIINITSVNRSNYYINRIKKLKNYLLLMFVYCSVQNWKEMQAVHNINCLVNSTLIPTIGMCGKLGLLNVCDILSHIGGISHVFMNSD